MNLSDPVLLKRLLPHLPDPFQILGVGRNTNFDNVEPRSGFEADGEVGVKDQRGPEYSRGRIRYFRDLFLANKPVDPIEMDNRWSGSRPYALVLLDGHHRLCGAILAKSDHVVVSYSGAVDALDWLKGDHDNCPDWLSES